MKRSKTKTAMVDCSHCIHSEMDYEDFYGGGRQWFPVDCKKDGNFDGSVDGSECKYYEEACDL